MFEFLFSSLLSNIKFVKCKHLPIKILFSTSMKSCITKITSNFVVSAKNFKLQVYTDYKGDNLNRIDTFKINNSSPIQATLKIKEFAIQESNLFLALFLLFFFLAFFSPKFETNCMRKPLQP